MIPRIIKNAPSHRQFSSVTHSEAYAKLISRSWAAPTDGSAHSNFIGGRFVESKADTFYDVHDPVCENHRLELMIGNAKGGITNTSDYRPGAT